MRKNGDRGETKETIEEKEEESVFFVEKYRRPSVTGQH